MSRRSYSGLSKLPAWGLYVGERIIASVRAKTAEDAEEIFRRHGLSGVEVRPVGYVGERIIPTRHPRSPRADPARGE